MLVVLAGLLVACGAPLPESGAPLPEAGPPPTSAPTWMPLPTEVAFAAPTLTPTFLPSPTPPPSATFTETPEPGNIASSPTSAVSATPTDEGDLPAALSAAVAFTSNLRAGPGLAYDVLALVEAGVTVEILARDAASTWLLVRTPTGFEGWVARMQFPPTLEIAAVPEAENTPTPPPTVTPTLEDAVTPTSESGGAALFELPVTGEVQCQALVVPFASPFPVGEVSQVYMPYDDVSPATVTEPTPAFQLDRDAVPFVISLYVDGPAKARGCLEDGSACTSVTLILCAAATTGATPGNFDYGQPLILHLGTQHFDQFTRQASAEIPTSIRIIEAPTQAP